MCVGVCISISPGHVYILHRPLWSGTGPCEWHDVVGGSNPLTISPVSLFLKCVNIRACVGGSLNGSTMVYIESLARTQLPNGNENITWGTVDNLRSERCCSWGYLMSGIVMAFKTLNNWLSVNWFTIFTRFPKRSILGFLSSRLLTLVHIQFMYKRYIYI